MDQDATWYGGRPRPRPHCVRCRTESLSPSLKRGYSPHFRSICLLWPNGSIKTPVGTETGFGPGHIVLDGDAAPLPKGAQPVPPLGRGSPPQFSAHVSFDQTAGWTKMPLGTKVGLVPGHIVLHGDPAPPSKRGTAPTPSFRLLSIVAKRLPT